MKQLLVLMLALLLPHASLATKFADEAQPETEAVSPDFLQSLGIDAVTETVTDDQRDSSLVMTLRALPGFQNDLDFDLVLYLLDATDRPLIRIDWPEGSNREPARRFVVASGFRLCLAIRAYDNDARVKAGNYRIIFDARGLVGAS